MTTNERGCPHDGSHRNTPAEKSLSLLLALALAFCLAVPALAAYPDRPENQYVLDEADVLSEETEQEIIAENQDLFQETGAQIVVVAVDFLDGEDIDDYAYSLFNIWGIGSQERNNGLLLLLAIGEENYYAQAGTGIEGYFDGAKLQDMLDQYLEPDFAARDYDAGVDKFFQAALADMESYYANYSDEYTDSPTYEEDYDTYYEPSFGERMSYFFGTCSSGWSASWCLCWWSVSSSRCSAGCAGAVVPAPAVAEAAVSGPGCSWAT